MIEHRITSCSNCGLLANLNQLLPVKLLQQLLGKSSRQAHSFSHCVRSGLSHHGHVLKDQVTQETFGNSCFREFLRNDWPHSFDFTARKNCGLRHHDVFSQGASTGGTPVPRVRTTGLAEGNHPALAARTVSDADHALTPSC